MKSTLGGKGGAISRCRIHMGSSCRSDDRRVGGVPYKKLIFIGACARSAPLFEEKVAADCGATVVGEIRWYWHRGVVANERCSCGTQFKDCEFWSEISTSRNRRLGVLMEEHKQFFDGARNLLPLYVPFCEQESGNFVGTFMLQTVFVSEVFAEADCVLNSSKRPFYFLVLQKALKDGFEFWFISFSRDPRGVANSWENASSGLSPETRANDYVRTLSRGDVLECLHDCVFSHIPHTKIAPPRNMSGSVKILLR